MIPTVNSSIQSAQIMLEHIQREQQLAKAVEDRDPRVMSVMTSFDRQNLLRSQLVASLWRKVGRQVLAIHPEIVEEVRVATSDRVPAEILRVLPYINPMVVYADPPEFNSWVHPKEEISSPVAPAAARAGAESRMRLMGFFTAASSTYMGMDEKGRSYTEQRVHLTTDNDADRMTVLLFFQVLDNYGKVVDYETATVNIPFGFTGTLSEMVKDILGRYHWGANPKGDKEDPRIQTYHRKWMHSVMSVAIGSLFYLCSTILEAEPVSPKYVSKRIPKRVVKTPLSFYKVGWTTGASLSRLRAARNYSDNPSTQGDLSHQQDPQHRRGHFKMQAHGPNKTLRKLIYVSPYWTHKERLGEVGLNTAHSVKRVGGKGEARESMEVARELPLPEMSQ